MDHRSFGSGACVGPYADARWAQLSNDELVDAGAERGVQVAVYQDGEQVVEAVAGVADPETGAPVTRGLFGYDTPVAELWPAFAAHGKQAVTVRHVLNHTAGVPAIPLETTVEDLCDWDRMCAAIADAEPWWAPGTRVGYHAYTFGYILGEVTRRATGRRISELLATEVAEPLGVVGELCFGMPADEQHRLARLEDEPGAAEMAAQMLASMPPDLPMLRSGPPSP